MVGWDPRARLRLGGRALRARLLGPAPTNVEDPDRLKREDRTATMSQTATTDLGQLVTRYESGDDQAFNKLYRATINAVSACAYAFAGPNARHDAEDAIAHVYARWATKPPQLDDPDGFLAYARTSVCNYLRDAAARRGRTTPSEWIDEPDHQQTERLVESADAQSRLYADLVDVLGERNADLLVQRDVHGVSPAELARQAGLSVTYVQVLLSECRKKARERLDRKQYSLLPVLQRWWNTVQQVGANGLAATAAAIVPAIIGLAGIVGLLDTPDREADRPSELQLVVARHDEPSIRPPSPTSSPRADASAPARPENSPSSPRPLDVTPSVESGLVDAGLKDEEIRDVDVSVKAAGIDQEVSTDVPGWTGEDVHVRVDADCPTSECASRATP